VSRLRAGLLVATVAGAAVVLVLMALGRLGRRSAVPFGPILIGAGVVATILP
jgi:prepilin signal peptidase PulO-like enzyme (type II secretory pathway)